MFDSSIFAQRVRMARLSKKLTQSALAEVLGVTKTYVSDLERSRRTTTIEKFVTLADVLDVSTDYLFGRTDDPNSHK